jgi:hypothetical protein
MRRFFGIGALLLMSSSMASAQTHPDVVVSNKVQMQPLTAEHASQDEVGLLPLTSVLLPEGAVLPASPTPFSLNASKALDTIAVGDDTPFTFPAPAPVRPVAIPFPTAAHLFVPGALLALYATRRFRGRRR